MSLLKYVFIALFAFAVQTSFATGMVNLNSATQTELEALPGVGAKLAGEIIAKRPFKTIDDLKTVKGIGEAKFNTLKTMVSAGATETETATATTTGMPKTMDRVAKTAATKLNAGEKVSLNNASVDQLEKLPGIGPKKAQAIIQARPFNTVEDVMKVKGIKAGIFNKIKNDITL